MKKGELLIILLVLFLFVQFIQILTTVYVYTRLESLGRVTESGTVSLTTVGTAGISLSDDIISFGSGYYNGSCFLPYAQLNSNLSRNCWVNVTTFPGSEDVHVLTNTGNVVVNVTASLVNTTDAEMFFCNAAQGCNVSLDSEILIQSLNNEDGSCVGLSTGFEALATNSSNVSVGICDSFDYSDSNDTIKLYLELHVPRDSRIGNKTLYLNYEAIAA